VSVNVFFRFWYFITQNSFKVLFRNTNHVTDQLNKFEFCARLYPAVNKLVFSDEARFHLSGRVNRHNLWTWGSEDPREWIEHERDSPNVNVFAAVSREKLYGSFFYRINSDRDHLPGHVTWMVNAAAVGGHSRHSDNTTRAQYTDQRDCANTDQEICYSMWQEVEYRFDFAPATHGAHIELY
jgi:hypothetical protein